MSGPYPVQNTAIHRIIPDSVLNVCGDAPAGVGAFRPAPPPAVARFRRTPRRPRPPAGRFVPADLAADHRDGVGQVLRHQAAVRLDHLIDRIAQELGDTQDVYREDEWLSVRPLHLHALHEPGCECVPQVV